MKRKIRPQHLRYDFEFIEHLLKMTEDGKILTIVGTNTIGLEGYYIQDCWIDENDVIHMSFSKETVVK